MDERVDESRKFFGGIYHPWRRYFARLGDLLLFGSIALYIVSLSIDLLYSANPIPRLLESKVTGSFLLTAFYLPLIPLESLLISRFGSTPAKWVFGITVLSESGDRLRIGPAFKRTLLASIVGHAVGARGVRFVALLISYFRLVKQGKTMWDDRVTAVVTHTEWSFLRAMVCASYCSLVALFFGFVMGTVAP